jgi:hypothetical protein
MLNVTMLPGGEFIAKHDKNASSKSMLLFPNAFNDCINVVSSIALIPSDCIKSTNY